MTEATNKMMDDSRFWLTGSDFSELAILNYSHAEGMSKHVDQEKSLKTARFKRMDWDKIEKNFIAKAAGTRHHALASQDGGVNNKIKVERQSIEELDHSKEEEPMTVCQTQSPSSRPVDWVNYLPRLRKSLRGLHPAKLQGEIWPQKQRTITYKGATLSPVKASKVASHRYQQTTHTNQNKMMSTTFNFADKISRVKIPAISLNTDIMMDQYGSKPTTKEILQRARSQERSGSMAYDRNYDKQHVFIVNEESGLRHKTPAPPLNKEYDGRYYQSTGVHEPISNAGASSPACTFRVSQNRQLMSPRFNRGETVAPPPFVNQTMANGSTAYATPSKNDFGSTLGHPTPSPMTSARATSGVMLARTMKNHAQRRISNTMVSETETLIDQQEFGSQNSQMENYKVSFPTDRSSGSGLAVQNSNSNKVAYRVSYRPLNDRHPGNKPLTHLQPSSLNIKQITPAPVELAGKVSPRGQQSKVYAGLIRDDGGEAHGSMQVVVNMKKGHVKQSQDRFNVSGSISKHTLAAKSPTETKKSGSKFFGNSKFAPKDKPKNFKKTIEQLYRKNEENSEQHQSNYLHRVERIMEETSPRNTPTRGDLNLSPSQPLTEVAQDGLAILDNQAVQSQKNIERDSANTSQQKVKLQGVVGGRVLTTGHTESAEEVEKMIEDVENGLPAENWSKKKQMEREIKFVCKTEASDDALGIVATGVKLHQGNKVTHFKQQQEQRRARVKAENQSKENEDIGNTQNQEQNDQQAQADFGVLEEPVSPAASPGIRMPVKALKQLRSETVSNDEDAELGEQLMGSQASHIGENIISDKIIGEPRYHEPQSPTSVMSQSRKKNGSSLQEKMNRQKRLSRLYSRHNEPSSPGSPSNPSKLNTTAEGSHYEEMMNGTIRVLDSAGGALEASTVATVSTSGAQRNFDSRSRSIQLEGIFVRKPNQLVSFRPVPIDTTMAMTSRNSRNNSTQLSPLRPKQLNLASIPDSIRTVAVRDAKGSVAPRTKHNRRHSMLGSMTKPKRVENIETILNRVLRANCCLANQNPEQLDVMQRAVGDSVADLVRQPGRKALRIRLKFLQNQFLQNVGEDFMNVQNLDREVDKTIEISDSMFRKYDIVEADEQRLMIRLFKRLYFSTIERKFGYYKVVKDKVEVSGRMLCSELEINPKVLPLCGVMTVFSEDAMIQWHSFLKIMTLFLLQKDVMEFRYEFILKFLKFTTNHTDLDRADYLQEMLNKFQFSKRSIIVQNVQTMVFWNKLRVVMANHREEIFDLGRTNTLNMMRAVQILEESDMTAEETFPFFDTLFEIA